MYVSFFLRLLLLTGRSQHVNFQLSHDYNDFIEFLMALIWEDNWVKTWECLLQYRQCKLYSLSDGTLCVCVCVCNVVLLYLLLQVIS